MPAVFWTSNGRAEKFRRKISKPWYLRGDIRALRDIETLAEVNYGEDTMGKGVPLPKELKYLK